MTREEAILLLHDMKDTYDEIHENTNYEIGYEQMTALDMALDALKAEAVRLEIVSCKDCKHWKEWENGSGHCGRSENPHFWFGSDADDFCSWGERKGGDDE